MDTSDLPTAVTEFPFTDRRELYEIAETIVGNEIQTPPGRPVDTVERLEAASGELTSSVGRCAVDPEKPNLTLTLSGRSERRTSADV
ncbi:hypothetical protein BRD16_04360 [Halobacteriales archaeon SW_6_65_46]|nr:MAG: hypothetical protein BRD16_04360 [Halobacteriales archaeon SW_6_65_46]